MRYNNVVKEIIDINNGDIDRVSVIYNVNRRVMETGFKYIPVMVEKEMCRNVIFDLYHTNIDAFRFFIRLCLSGDIFTFNELCLLYSKNNKISCDIEKCIDIYIYSGLLFMEYDKNIGEFVYVIKEYISDIIREYLVEDNAFNRYFFLYDLYYRYKELRFLSETLNINSLLSHIPYIPNKLFPVFYIEFNNPISYKELYNILSSISNIYTPNIKYYQWGFIRVTLCNLDDWINDSSIVQSKLMITLFIDNVSSDDILVCSMYFIPVINANKDIMFGVSIDVAYKFISFLRKYIGGFSFSVINYSEEHIDSIDKRFDSVENKDICELINSVDVEILDKFVLTRCIINIGISEITLCDYLCCEVFKYNIPDIIVCLSDSDLDLLKHLLNTEVCRYFEYKTNKGEIDVNIDEIKKLFINFRNYMDGVKIMTTGDFIKLIKKEHINNSVMLFSSVIYSADNILDFIRSVQDIVDKDTFHSILNNLIICGYIMSRKNEKNIYNKLGVCGLDRKNIFVYEVV